MTTAPPHRLSGWSVALLVYGRVRLVGVWSTGRKRLYGLTNLERKYPNASAEWRWQWFFPQEHRWKHRTTGEEGRHHTDESVIQKAVRVAVNKAGLIKRVSCYTSAGKRLCYPDNSGVDGAQGCAYDHDLYACIEEGWQRSQQSLGWNVSRYRQICLYRKWNRYGKYNRLKYREKRIYRYFNGELYTVRTFFVYFFIQKLSIYC